MTKSKKLSANEQAESSLDAVRRHLCQILGFDLGILDLVNGDELVTVAQVSADTKSKASELLSVLTDENKESISFANTQLAHRVKQNKKPFLTHVFNENGDQSEDNVEKRYPYAIIPIGGSEGEQSPILGLIRVVAYDNNRKISKYDMSTLKLTGEHLASQLQNYGHMMGIPVNNGQNAKTANILLAHSSRPVRRRFSRILANTYQVHEADSAKKVQEILEEQSIDLILLDSQFPGITTAEFCKKLKTSEKLQNIPVVLVTTNSETKVEEQNLGVDDYLAENCSDQELLTRVKSIVRFYQLQEDLTRQTELLENYSQRLEEASAKLSNNEQAQVQHSKEFQFLKWESEFLREQEKRLHRISNDIRRSFNIEENLQEVLENLQGWLNLNVCFITLPAPDEPEDEIRCEYAIGEDYKVVEFDLDLKAFEVFKKHYKVDEPLIVNQVDSDPRVNPFKKEAISRHNVLSLFYVPISHKEELLGLLCGFKCEAEARWNQDNIAFLQSVADQVAIGVTNARLYARVQRQATTDGLTGLLNHRTGQEKLSEQLRIAERYQRNLAVMMIDVDHFKSINDSYGHPAGDAVLKAVARRIERDCRDVDLSIRYGGEEFLLILPEVNMEGAIIVAERIRKNLAEEEIVFEGLDVIKVTASLGIAAFPENARSQQQLLDMADRALYLSKRMGRNQIRTVKDLNFESETPEEPEVIIVNESAEVADHIKEKPEMILPPPVSEEASVPGEKEELLPEVVEMVKALATALYSKSEYNKMHHLETARLSEILARVMGLPQKQIEQIRVAGLLHDVGTLSVPPDLMNKSGTYTPEEREMINQHSVLGAELLRPIRALKEICDILENHHERWDGTGHPNGLKGEEIPLPARIVSIVDSYHALISDRPYRPAMNEEEALTTLKAGAGKQWDPFLVDIFISVITNLKESGNQMKAHSSHTAQ